MANQEILNYLEQFAAGGKGFDEAKKVLLGVGWGEAEIDEAIRQLSAGVALKANVAPAPNIGSSPVSQNIRSSATSPANAQKTSVVVLSPEPAKGINKKVLFSVIVIVSCLLGGGAYAYFGLGIGASEKPEEVLNEALTNLWNVKTLNSASHFELNYTGTQLGMVPMLGGLEKEQAGKTVSVGMSLDVKGVADISDWSKQKVAGQSDLGLNLPGMPKVSIKSDLVQADGVMYLRMKDVNQWSALVEPFIGDMSSLEGKWIKIDLAEATGLFGGFGLLNSISGFQALSQLKTSPNLELGAVGGLVGGVPPMIPQISQAQTQEIKGILEKNRIFIVSKEFPSEKVDNENSYHYRLALDKVAIKNLATDFMVMFQKAMMEQFGIKAPVSTADELQKARVEMSDGLSKVLDEAEKFIQDNVQVASADVWIGKSSKQIKKVALDFTVKHDSLGGKIQFKSEVTYSKIGEPVAVEVPKDAVLFESVMKELAQNTNGAIFSGEQDSTRTSDLATIKSALSLYGADVVNAKFCKDKNTIYASAPIKVPVGWKLGPNIGSQKVDGTGWIPVNLNDISSGAPISQFFIDPKNDPLKKLVYIYACDPASSGFEVNALLVSDKFVPVMASDGGDDPKVYEVGTSPGLKLIPKGFWDHSF